MSISSNFLFKFVTMRVGTINLQKSSCFQSLIIRNWHFTR